MFCGVGQQTAATEACVWQTQMLARYNVAPDEMYSVRKSKKKDSLLSGLIGQLCDYPKYLIQMDIHHWTRLPRNNSLIRFHHMAMFQKQDATPTQGKNLNMLSVNGYVILLIPIPSYLINNIIIFPLTQNQTRKKNCIFVQNYTPSFNSQYRIVSYKRTD